MRRKQKPRINIVSPELKVRELTANEITEQAEILLAARGLFTWRQNNHATRGRKFIGLRGVADRIGLNKHNGYASFVACETKAPRDKLSDEQRAFLNLVAGAGGHAFVAESINGKCELISWQVTL